VCVCRHRLARTAPGTGTGIPPYSEGFETGVGAWAPWSATSTIASSADTARAGGTKSLKMTPVGAGPSNSRYVPAFAINTQSTMTVWAKGTGTAKAYVQYFNAAWAQLTSPPAQDIVLTGSFAQSTINYTPPTGTANVIVAFQNASTSPWYLDDVTITTAGGTGPTPTTALVPTGSTDWASVTTNSTPGVQLTTWVHTVTATDPLQWTFPLSQTARAAGTMGSYSGVDLAARIDTSNTKANIPAGLVHSVPTVTTNGANRLVVTINAATSATMMSEPSGSIERADQPGDATTPTTSIETSEFAQATAGLTAARNSGSATATTTATATVALKPVNSTTTSTGGPTTAFVPAGSTDWATVTTSSTPGVRLTTFIHTVGANEPTSLTFPLSQSTRAPPCQGDVRPLVLL
jgi:hypothetical protein